MIPRTPTSSLFPYTTLFRSNRTEFLGNMQSLTAQNITDELVKSRSLNQSLADLDKISLNGTDSFFPLVGIKADNSTESVCYMKSLTAHNIPDAVDKSPSLNHSLAFF